MQQSIDRFISLFHRRWTVRVLIALAHDGGAKFITLTHCLGAGRETLRSTLEHLIELGLVHDNPGYGHPLRPEYVLTDRGARLAAKSVPLLATVRRLDIEPIAFRKWTLPLTYVLGADERRFTEIRDELPGITARALTLSLKDMQGTRLVQRQIYDAYPPMPCYRLRARARPVIEALGPMASVV